MMFHGIPLFNMNRFCRVPNVETPVVVIGFTGLARSGKTTAARIFKDVLYENLEESLPTRDLYIEIMSFAGPIKDGLQTMGITKDKNHDLYRFIAQTIGGKCREVKDEWWADVLQDKISERFSGNHLNPGIVLIDDVRYLNEVSMIQQLGGYLFHIDASSRITGWQDSPMYQHESETLARECSESIHKHGIFTHMSGVHPGYTGDNLIGNNGDVESFESLCIYGASEFAQSLSQAFMLQKEK